MRCFDRGRWPVKKAIPPAVVVTAAFLISVPLALPANAGRYITTAVYQASGTPSPPANGNSPFASCDISRFLLPGETNYVNSELEPWIAVNPTDPSNMIGVYQQDRYTFGGARGLAAAVTHDGGATWTATHPAFSVCAGGTQANGGSYQRASDPWVTFAPNGDAYFISLSLSFVGSTAETATAVLVSKSTDGGDHWSDPVTVVRNLPDVAPFYFNDKESITADPLNSNRVYAVWDRLRKPGEAESVSAEHSFAFRGDTMFSRTINGGQTWSQPKAILKLTKLTGSIGNQIAVLPDGTLVDIFDFLQGSGRNAPGFDIMAQRSTDHGRTWSRPTEVAPERSVRVFDPDTGASVRAGGGLPDIAVDLNPASPGFGNLYAVWGDSFGSGKTKKGRHSTVVFTESTDGGRTWSPLSRIDRSPGTVQAFTPSVHVASDGTVGVTYYDFRHNTSDPGVPTDQWFIHCHATADCTDPANWSENHVAGSFDIENAPVSRGYFLGDYEGLDSIGTTFTSFFSQTTPTDTDNTYLATISPK
jgi:BNR/Asp-box repeat